MRDRKLNKSKQIEHPNNFRQSAQLKQSPLGDTNSTENRPVFLSLNWQINSFNQTVICWHWKSSIWCVPTCCLETEEYSSSTQLMSWNVLSLNPTHTLPSGVWWF